MTVGIGWCGEEDRGAMRDAMLRRAIDDLGVAVARLTRAADALEEAQGGQHQGLRTILRATSERLARRLAGLRAAADKEGEGAE